jgi:uncharacterized protein
VSLYLDASVIVPTLVVEDVSPVVIAFLANTQDELLVSDYAAAEVASGISRLVRMRDLTEDQGLDSLRDFDAWLLAATTSVEVDNLDIRSAAAFVRRFELKLRTPDALHLAASMRLNSQLMTGDGGLAAAAAACGAAVIHLTA